MYIAAFIFYYVAYVANGDKCLCSFSAYHKNAFVWDIFYIGLNGPTNTQSGCPAFCANSDCQVNCGGNKIDGMDFCGCFISAYKSL